MKWKSVWVDMFDLLPSKLHFRTWQIKKCDSRNGRRQDSRRSNTPDLRFRVLFFAFHTSLPTKWTTPEKHSLARAVPARGYASCRLKTLVYLITSSPQIAQLLTFYCFLMVSFTTPVRDLALLLQPRARFLSKFFPTDTFAWCHAVFLIYNLLGNLQITRRKCRIWGNGADSGAFSVPRGAGSNLNSPKMKEICGFYENLGLFPFMHEK